MYNWITELFGCQECKKNFILEVEKVFKELNLNPDDGNKNKFKPKMLCSLDQTESNIFLWKLHNSVNKRLALEEQTTGESDPKFIKKVWPGEEDCK
mmetsp:Transcript_108741/g.234108  ORF Transcript_108741/g.234108 Transcript_108741/m.234108 type:complete len:96 (-) Transcript_108741:138-425(-)